MDLYHPDAATFGLDLWFLAPLGVDQPTVFDATFQGVVTPNFGEVLISFGPARSFTFHNAVASGSFDLKIDDLTLVLERGSGSVSHRLTGSISDAVDPPVIEADTPEPSTFVFLGTIALVMVGLRRRSCR